MHEPLFQDQTGAEHYQGLNGVLTTIFSSKGGNIGNSRAHHKSWVWEIGYDNNYIQTILVSVIPSNPLQLHQKEK